MFWVSEYEDRTVSYRAIETASGYEVFGSGMSGTEFERNLERQARQDLGRRPVEASIRVHISTHRRGAGVPTNFATGTVLVEAFRDETAEVEVFANAGFRSFVYRSNQPVEDRTSRDFGNRPEMIAALGYTGIDQLDGEREIERIIDALVQTARADQHLGLASVAPVLSAGGTVSSRSPAALLAFASIGAVYGAYILFLLVLFGIYMLRSRKVLAAMNDDQSLSA
jgi:hypothetical protein